MAAPVCWRPNETVSAPVPPVRVAAAAGDGNHDADVAAQPGRADSVMSNSRRKQFLDGVVTPIELDVAR